MAAGNWIVYDAFREAVADGTIDLDNDTFNVILLSDSYTPSAAHSDNSDLTNEVANGNGYTTGGQALSSVTWGHSGTTATFDAADITWSASSGDIGPFRYAVINDVTADHLVAYCNLGSDFTILDGNDFTIQMNASGILTLSGAAS